jgi:chromosome segregation ATPase
MSTLLAILAGVGGLAGLVLGLLWRRERAKRQLAEQRADLQAVRADAEAGLRKQLQESEAAWRRKHEALQREAAQTRLEAVGIRAEIDSVAGDPQALSDRLNRAFGHDME